MLIKEYRIPLPMTVEEYRIAQLYMIAKKSREESKGAESGVEILINEPYTDGPGGKGGQYTHKIYHVGSHLPAWLKSLVPKTALIVEEEAWNAYPYTKTRFKCPFVEKFSLECETYYTPDGGHQENIFNMSESDKRNRTVDLIDIVKDNEGAVYEDPEKEDPTQYVSENTGRGPLGEYWIEEHWSDCEGKEQPTENGNAIMCAYKLCKVEFRYWGMQSKIERFIHDIALRKTMLSGHLKAWTWQDEWYGLTMEDIRAIERDTADLLNRRMQELNGELPDDGGYEPGINESTNNEAPGNNNAVASDMKGGNCVATTDNTPLDTGGRHQEMRATFKSIEYTEAEIPNIIPKGSEMMSRRPVTSSASLNTAVQSSSEAMKPRTSGALTELEKGKPRKCSLEECEGREIILYT